METNKPKTQRNNYKKKYELTQGSIKNLENVCDQYLLEIKTKDATIDELHIQNTALKNELSIANQTIYTLQNKELNQETYIKSLNDKDSEIDSLKDTIANLGDKIRKYETSSMIHSMVIIILFVVSLVLTLLLL